MKENEILHFPQDKKQGFILRQSLSPLRSSQTLVKEEVQVPKAPYSEDERRSSCYLSNVREVGISLKRMLNMRRNVLSSAGTKIFGHATQLIPLSTYPFLLLSGPVRPIPDLSLKGIYSFFDCIDHSCTFLPVLEAYLQILNPGSCWNLGIIFLYALISLHAASRVSEYRCKHM